MAEEQRCILYPAGPLPPPAASAADVPAQPKVDAPVTDTSPRADADPVGDGVSAAFAPAFLAPLPGTVNPRTGNFDQPPPSFAFFHIRPRGGGFSGFPGESEIRNTFCKAAKQYEIRLPQYIALPEMANATAPGWSLIICRSVDAPVLKRLVRTLKEKDMKLLEYDGTAADDLYPPTEAALPSVCGNLHRVGNMAFDMSHIWFGGENNPQRVHVKYRFSNLRFAGDDSYQTAACVLLRFVHNRVSVLLTENPHVASLLSTFCSTSAVACLQETIDAQNPHPAVPDSDASVCDEEDMDLDGSSFPPLLTDADRAAREAALRKGAALNHKARAAADRQERGSRALGGTGSPPNANDRQAEKRTADASSPVGPTPPPAVKARVQSGPSAHVSPLPPSDDATPQGPVPPVSSPADASARAPPGGGPTGGSPGLRSNIAPTAAVCAVQGGDVTPARVLDAAAGLYEVDNASAGEGQKEAADEGENASAGEGQKDAAVEGVNAAPSPPKSTPAGELPVAGTTVATTAVAARSVANNPAPHTTRTDGNRELRSGGAVPGPSAAGSGRGGRGGRLQVGRGGRVDRRGRDGGARANAPGNALPVALTDSEARNLDDFDHECAQALAEARPPVAGGDNLGSTASAADKTGSEESEAAQRPTSQPSQAASTRDKGDDEKSVTSRDRPPLPAAAATPLEPEALTAGHGSKTPSSAATPATSAPRAPEDGPPEDHDDLDMAEEVRSDLSESEHASTSGDATAQRAGPASSGGRADTESHASARLLDGSPAAPSPAVTGASFGNPIMVERDNRMRGPPVSAAPAVPVESAITGNKRTQKKKRKKAKKRAVAAAAADVRAADEATMAAARVATALSGGESREAGISGVSLPAVRGPYGLEIYGAASHQC